jgi:hypothetical protein
MKRVCLKITTLICAAMPSLVSNVSSAGEFSLLPGARGNLATAFYLNPDSAYFSDITLGVAVDIFRYGGLCSNLHLSKETSIGKNARGVDLMHPDRGDYSFGLSWRLQLPRHFIEAHYHHDSFHSIDRWEEQSIYWNSPRVAFGSKGYLPQFRFLHRPGPYSSPRIDYLIQANFYAPRGASWQKRHGYDFSWNTNARYGLIRFNRFGADLESVNLWVASQDGKLNRQHFISASLLLSGDRGLLELYLGWWPYDNQPVRNRSGRAVAGLRLSS